MAKAICLRQHRGQYVHKVIVGIIPPLITAGVMKVRYRLLRHHLLSSALPVSREYSTVDNPIEVPCQVECYLLCREKYLKPTDTVLDVGFGLGYGLQIMAAKVEKLLGVEVDVRAVDRARRIFAGHPRVASILIYDGVRLPLQDKSVDVITCVEILEHVEAYKNLLLEMARVARRAVFISTPNQRPENTLPSGRPKNYWHLREWTKAELEAILIELGLKSEWNFLNGPFQGPFNWTKYMTESTFSLVPVVLPE